MADGWPEWKKIKVAEWGEGKGIPNPNLTLFLKQIMGAWVVCFEADTKSTGTPFAGTPERDRDRHAETERQAARQTHVKQR